MTIQTLVPVIFSNEIVLTSEQVADFYDCTTDNIKVNFNANKEKFKEGVHLFRVEGELLKEFKVRNPYLVGANAKTLYLWTKRGCARHAKMLSTERAWEVFEELEENYFNAKEVQVATTLFKKPMTFSGILQDVDESKALIQKIYAVKDGIATAQATNMVGKFYKYDLSELKSLIPPAEHETGYLNATQLGEKVGKSARAVNQFLKEKGLQFRDGKDWRLTENGKQYAEEIPYDTGKHSGYQIRWSLPTVEFFLEEV